MEIHSIALPPLGCGNGGLDWSTVRQEIEGALSELTNVEVIVYSPTRTYQNVSKKAGLDKLTPARALISELVRRYAVLGLESHESGKFRNSRGFFKNLSGALGLWRSS